MGRDDMSPGSGRDLSGLLDGSVQESTRSKDPATQREVALEICDSAEAGRAPVAGGGHPIVDAVVAMVGLTGRIAPVANSMGRAVVACRLPALSASGCVRSPPSPYGPGPSWRAKSAQRSAQRWLVDALADPTVPSQRFALDVLGALMSGDLEIQCAELAGLRVGLPNGIVVSWMGLFGILRSSRSRLIGAGDGKRSRADLPTRRAACIEDRVRSRRKVGGWRRCAADRWSSQGVHTRAWRRPVVHNVRPIRPRRILGQKPSVCNIRRRLCDWNGLVSGRIHRSHPQPRRSQRALQSPGVARCPRLQILVEQRIGGGHQYNELGKEEYVLYRIVLLGACRGIFR